MGNVENGFNKKRDHNQYGEENKTPEQEDKHRELPKMPNKGTQPKPNKDKKSKSK
ncbi:hypothetical protein [Aequorivita capsosiphonis]|uniref:hypothetical protein n=1 Tax=Aequorivita capsosiphonis TaxID=487317 RepID=UPI0004080FCB|nr:hypothetical protein [Aequorivita capsosiphonis]